MSDTNDIVKSLVDDIKKDVINQVRCDMKEIIEDVLKSAVDSAHIKEFVLAQIHQATKTIEVTHANIVTKDVEQARIVTPVRESEEMRVVMNELNKRIKELESTVREFNYEDKLDKAIKAVTKDKVYTNAIIRDQDVVHAVIREEDYVVKNIKEEVEIVKRQYEITEPVYRKNYIYLNELYESKGGARIA